MRMGLRRPHRVVQQGLVAEYRFDRKNLLLWSEDYSQWQWTKGRTTVSGKYIYETNELNTHYITQTVPVNGALTYTLMLKVKANGRHEGRLYLQSTDYFGVYYNLNTVTVSDFKSGSGTVAYKQIQDVGDSYFLVACVGSLNNAATSAVLNVRLYNGTSTYQGDVTKGIIADYVQVERGSAATTYQRTIDGQAMTDDSGRGNNGQFGSTAGVDVNDPTPDGQGLRFGPDDFIVAGQSSDFVSGSNPHSYIVAVRPTALLSPYNYFIATGNNANGQQSGIGVTNTGAFFTSAYSNPLVTFATALSLNTNYILTAVYTGTHMLLYINGEFVESQAIALNTTTGKLYVAAHTGVSSYLDNGVIYFECVYINKALTPAEVAFNTHRVEQLLAKRGVLLAA